MNKLLSWIFPLFISFIVCIFEGTFISNFWGWFVAPTFNLPILSLEVAFGINILLIFLGIKKIRFIDTKKVSNGKLFDEAFDYVATLSFLFWFGYLLRHFA